VPMGDQHAYRCDLTWRGSTGAGYDDYEREHRVRVPPAREELRLSSDPAFRGDPELPNPEQLLLAAASSCQLLEFLALAARSRIDVLAYEDRAEAVMPEDAKPMRITEITLRPRIVVARSADLDRVARLVERAHEHCYVANTLNARIALEPGIEERSA
jgi:organic hydroperoxide reductase OsmC/OhrA